MLTLSSSRNSQWAAHTLAWIVSPGSILRTYGNVIEFPATSWPRAFFVLFCTFYGNRRFFLRRKCRVLGWVLENRARKVGGVIWMSLNRSKVWLKNIDLLININEFYIFLTLFYTFYNESEIFKCKKFWFLNINSNITRKILGIFNWVEVVWNSNEFYSILLINKKKYWLKLYIISL